MDHQSAVIYQMPVAGKKTSNKIVELGATEETDARPATLAAAEKSTSGGWEYLGAGRQNFTEEDFKNPAVAPKIARFLIAEIDRLANDCAGLKDVQTKHHNLCVEIAALKEGAIKNGIVDLLSVICLAAGSAGLGAAPSYLTVQGVHDVGWTFVIISGVLVVAGLIPPVVAFVSRVKK